MAIADSLINMTLPNTFRKFYDSFRTYLKKTYNQYIFELVVAYLNKVKYILIK